MYIHILALIGFFAFLNTGAMEGIHLSSTCNNFKAEEIISVYAPTALIADFYKTLKLNAQEIAKLHEITHFKTYSKTIEERIEHLKVKINTNWDILERGVEKESKEDFSFILSCQKKHLETLHELTTTFIFLSHIRLEKNEQAFQSQCNS